MPRKLLSILLTIVMLLGLTVPAGATAPDVHTHEEGVTCDDCSDSAAAPAPASADPCAGAHSTDFYLSGTACSVCGLEPSAQVTLRLQDSYSDGWYNGDGSLYNYLKVVRLLADGTEAEVDTALVMPEGAGSYEVALHIGAGEAYALKVYPESQAWPSESSFLVLDGDGEILFVSENFGGYTEGTLTQSSAATPSPTASARSATPPAALNCCPTCGRTAPAPAAALPASTMTLSTASAASAASPAPTPS